METQAMVADFAVNQLKSSASLESEDNLFVAWK